jgi:hypothetical protein
MAQVTRVAFLAAVGLLVGLLVAPPAAAQDQTTALTTLLGSLLGPAQGPEPDASAREPADYGRTTAPNGTLRRGCRNYRYHYQVSVPSGDWSLETFLRDPAGRGLASGMFLSDSDPRGQRTRFRFCRSSTRPGTFTIRALVHWYDDYGSEHRAWLDPSRFRLKRAR